MAVTIEHLAGALDLLRNTGIVCHVAGGWAEELLGLRPPGPHGDVDLIYSEDGWRTVDAWLHQPPSDFTEIAAKRFAHKRAFLLDGVCCEIVLVQLEPDGPITWFWGDVPFRWETPLLHAETVSIEGRSQSILSPANLHAIRTRHRETQPWRWQDPASLVG